MVNMRAFNDFEEQNLKFLVNHNVKFTQVEITQTGLGKGILDATAPMRSFFLENQIHDFALQEQGPENKCFFHTFILTETEQKETKTSFYRPLTKKGDPRIWIYGLTQYTQAFDIHILFKFESSLYCVNITRIDIEKCFNSHIINPLQEIIKEIDLRESVVSQELLHKFELVKGHWFEAEVKADTGIGRTIESFLGINMNSDKTPDYKGIELKSHREKRSSTKNVLFTQTPDWDISTLKSGREIVDKYGYFTEDGKKTYQNTVQCTIPNAQMLLLNVNEADEILELQAQKKMLEDIAVWRLMKLHQRLLTKHKETFWIEVENKIVDNKELFRYKEIEHTKNPNVGQFDTLLEQNIITVDLLLCRPSGNGDTYSFKIKKKGMPLLFPQSVIYTL